MHLKTSKQANKKSSLGEQPRDGQREPSPPYGCRAADSPYADTQLRHTLLGTIYKRPVRPAAGARRLVRAGASEHSTRRRRLMGTEDQREKAPSFLNSMLAGTDSFIKRQEEEREKQKHIISYKNTKENSCYTF